MPDGKTDIKPDQLRSVAADIDALGTAFDRVTQYATQNPTKAEHFGKIVGKSDIAGQAFQALATAMQASLGKGAAFIHGVAATLKASADQHGSTEQSNKENISKADGGA
ncbi:hypothetical protein [Actinocrispum sp. NPDC049592]|uniref:hypothetical protein n=1 Tax=Actinocrispum sp. NPDC049592 TaxID=3154835 RepID=UPI0034449A18